ncbi:hypothetical protein [Puia dinghuensis]|uniref:Uncharacterized protein n=1 Tax=Puia dinghuensis TaxID=1792502 RepID=A0A8J2UDC4_9BACT|nr:hypothetical protein [Puia dinghuensis]GGB01539.1 hypothetical protein GCM10011511_26080 [Puia dinghuensis]
MKKLLIPLALAILAGPSLQCRKEQSAGYSSTGAQLLQGARHYFEDSVAGLSVGSASSSSNLRISGSKAPLWADARTLVIGSVKAVVVPVRYGAALHVRSNFCGEKLFDLNELTRLLVYEDDRGRYHAEVITAFPDSLALRGGSGGFTGILLVEDWAGKRLHQYRYLADGSVLQAGSPDRFLGKGAGIAGVSGNTVTPDIVFTTCYEIDGYNYAEGDEGDGYAWSEPAGCSSEYYPVSASLAAVGGVGAGGYGSIAGGITGAYTINVATGGAAIPNVKAYFGCFTNSSSIDHTYTVTVCVAQPVAGTRAPWSFTKGGPTGSSKSGNPVNVGHSFLIFQENSAGTVITRNVGLYPAGLVNPFFPSDQAQLRNNENTDYNISLTYTVSNSQFFSMVNYVETGGSPGYIYNLSTNNCTTFVLTALGAGNVTLPSTIGHWTGGSGYDPGDLGEDIRSMPLGPKMSRNTVETKHPNTTTCN